MLNSPYIKGDITYGGVVSIYSKDGDIAGIDLPQFSQIFNFKMFYSSLPFGNNEMAEENEPKISNSLCWFTEDSKSTSLTNINSIDKKSVLNSSQRSRISIISDKKEIHPNSISEYSNINNYQFYTGDNVGEYLLIYTEITSHGLKKGKKKLRIE
jgi:hypothetical protein